ncbi:triple tyrosine motif-containing protein [Nafulsella turpanensis]|uniref:triple tyrosine motif-containing protein n=1 Tax=Nafulsella turpanensis TaxID=1265690 RepID=UPI000349DD07|nr:triple tyrosine motif-containing protein [Nafulsella turpanensis]
MAVSILLCLFFHNLKAQSFRGLPFIQTFGSGDYAAGIQNWDITQDARGLLYFANNFGLLEYDGHYWHTYPVKTGSKVRCVSVGTDGRVYTGSQGDFGYFSPSSNGSWVYTSLAEMLPEGSRNFDETWRIFQLKDKIYFCTFQNIYVYDGQSIETIHPPNPLEFSFLANDRLYVLDWERGLTVLQNKSLVPVNEGEKFRHQRLVAILPYDQQHLLIVTQQNGLFLYDGHHFSSVDPGPANILDQKLLNCAVRLRNGTYAIGSQSHGLFILDHQLRLVRQLDKEHGLNDHTILSLYEDRHHNLWAGHNNGLSYIELSSPFTLLDEKLKIPGSGYAAFKENDTLYLGTNNGLFAGVLQNSRSAGFQPVKNSQGQVYHISRQGDELLMGHHNGAFRIRNMEALPLSRQTGVWKFMRLQNSNRLMLKGTYSGFSLYEKEETGWRWKKDFSNFTESSRIFEEDEEGNIWMTHGYKGVYKLSFDAKKGKFSDIRFYGQKDGLPSNVLNNVHKLGNQLIFTAETGVYRYHSTTDRFVQDSSLTNVLGKGTHIQKLAQDANGRLYFMSSTKLGSVLQDEFGRWEADTNRFFKIINLLNDDLNYLTILDNQNVLFGAKEGFIHFNPMQVRTEAVPLQVLIRRVESNAQQDTTLFGGSFQPAGREPNVKTASLQLPYQQNSLRFRFSAPYFDGAAHLTYQYQLEGFEEGWSSWSAQAFKEYTNLPEGSYTFMVRAKNIYGEISPAARYEFKISPPWYRAPLAYFTYSLLLAGLFFVGIFTVDRKHKRERELLTLKQKKALNQKTMELDSLSKRSKDEITRLENEKLESEIRHKNKELATSTMHIVTKNEFIGEIKAHLNSIIREKESKGISKELNKIIKEIDQNIATDKDWEQFQIHFDRVHGDFSRRLRAAYPSLTPQEMKLCAYLRLNLSTKEIAQLMHISVRGVEISRYRLRKKLELDRQENLLEFILSF